jgi:hypothetical protein
VRMFIEAEKKQLTYNLTFNLRCRLQRGLLGNGVFEVRFIGRPSLPQFNPE